jgi:hypothetical protein
MDMVTQLWEHFRISVLIFVGLLLVILLSGCSSGLKVTSDRRQSDITIDGNDTEWQRGLYYDKESDFVYGIRNDDEYLYVFLKTQNRSTQIQILGAGLTVWFDAEGGKHQTFGIRYPLGRKETPQDFHPDADAEQMLSVMDQAMGELEVLGPKSGDVQRFPAFGAPGIRAKIGRNRDALTYELQVPLKNTPRHPFAINDISSNRIGVEFETGEFKHGKTKGEMSPEKGFNGGPSMGDPEREEGVQPEGRSHRGGLRGGEPGGRSKSTQMELWLSVQLAK